MVALGIIISCLVGFSILNFISPRFSILEKAGLSFLLGMAAQTLGMLLLDSAGIRLTVGNILVFSILLIVLLNIKTFLRRNEIIQMLRSTRFTVLPAGINLVWLLFIVLIVYLEYMNWTKCMFWPTFDRDSLAGFDTIGWIISREHTLKGLSVFQGDYMPGINGAGSYITYMPMIQLSYAYVYLLGAATSKLIPALIYLCFLVSFYAVANRFCGHTAAAMATFFILITPEMIAFSSLSGTNVIHAVYAALGVIYTVLWLREGDRAFFALAILLTAGGGWVRNESVVFVVASTIVIFLCDRKRRNYKDALLFAGISLSPFLLWNVFMIINGLFAESNVILRPFIDTEKMITIWLYLKSLLGSTLYYGLGFVLFPVAILLNIRNITGRREFVLPAITVLSLLFYAVLLYQIDYNWDTIQNVLSYSAKRFLFCFSPLVWLYIFSNQMVNRFFSKADKMLSLTNNDGGNRL